MNSPTVDNSDIPHCRVSIFLLAYRMEKTILQAFESALAQTVPCEIIVSDDASDDRGYEITRIKSQAVSTRHKVTVRRNATNQGLCAHIGTVAAIATGEIFVFMAADDVSHPDRVARLLHVFDEHADAFAVGSSVDIVDANDNLLKRRAWYLKSPMDQCDFWNRGKFVTLLGASMAIRRELLIGLPPLRGIVEDNMLTLRATLFGRVYCVEEALLDYRRHGSNLGDWIFGRDASRRNARRRRYERTIRMYREIADDHEQCLASLSDLAPERRLVGREIIKTYRIAADGREAVLNLPKRKWLKPITRGLRQRGARRRAIELAAKLCVPRVWLGL